MAVHRLSMIERKPGGYPAPDPQQTLEHHKAGRLPIYHNKKLVAYVDRAEDLPEAKYIKRAGRVVGEVSRWE
jgi:hypothetical protein